METKVEPYNMDKETQGGLPTGARMTVSEALEKIRNYILNGDHKDGTIAPILNRCDEALESPKTSEGNMQKMREALEMMNNLFERGVICTSYANSAEEMEQIEELYRKTKSALATPPRNCDIGTTEEQNERFKEFCDDSQVDEDYTSMCARCTLRNKKHCELAWAQMPYEDEARKEGDNDESR